MGARALCLSLACVCLIASGGMPVIAGTSKGLIAHWRFDELAEGAFKNAVDTGLAARAESGASARDGVLGAALRLEGRSVVRVRAGEAFEDLPGITISAWVQPTELSGYREIFRKEDGARRILFSFQNNGRILSLGLQTQGTGYQELDAPIEPALLMDRQWHHVADTYDGQRMKVYLDGLPIGSQRRSGRIVSGGAAERCRRLHRVLGGHGRVFPGGDGRSADIQDCVDGRSGRRAVRGGSLGHAG